MGDETGSEPRLVHVEPQVHRGPYTALGDAYGRLHDWIHAQGEDDGPGVWETYIDNPEEVENVSELRTEIRWLVAER